VFVDFVLLDFVLVGFALVVFALVWLTLVGFAVANIAHLSSATDPAEFKLFSGKPNDTPGSSTNPQERCPGASPAPRLPSSVRVLVGGLVLSLVLSLVLGLVLSLSLGLGLSIRSTGKRQTDNTQERAQGNCRNFPAFNTANDGSFPILFAAQALYQRRRHRLRRHDVGAAEDVRGRERVHVCRDGGGGRDRRQRCQIERHLRSVVAPVEASAQDGDTAVPELLQGTGDGHERVEGRGSAALELGGGRGGDVFGAVS